MGYFKNIKQGIRSTVKGLGLTLKHFWAARNKRGNLAIGDENYFKNIEGYATLQYPHESLIIPERGRNQLDCEIDDCIVCDKCAKICPVDCIEIESIKSPELIRNTSDGSPVRLYAAKFDIDLAKCCFCGLCTTVCPTDCLTMNSEYDYSVSEVNLLNFAFSNLGAEEANEKRELYDLFLAEKEAIKATKSEVIQDSIPKISGFKPKPSFAAKENETVLPLNQSKAFKPSLKSQESPIDKEVINSEPVKKTIFKPKGQNSDAVSETKINQEVTKLSGFRPKAKPEAISNESSIEKEIAKPIDISAEESHKTEPKKAFIPKLKSAINNELPETLDQTQVTKKPFIPKLKPEIHDSKKFESTETKEVLNSDSVPMLNKEAEQNENTPKPKFIPKLKPRD